MEPEETHQAFEEEDQTSAPDVTRRSIGHLAFAIMLLGGILGIWLLTRGGRLFDPSALSNVVQASGVQRIFVNPMDVGVIFFAAATIALWVSRRRRNSSLNILEA